MLVESQRAYSEKSADPAALSSFQTENPLDCLTWNEARQRGGDNFAFKGIKFATKGGILHWRTPKGRWVPETALASQPCRWCHEFGVQEDLLKHWRFHCPNWSRYATTGTWEWAPGSPEIQPASATQHHSVLARPNTVGRLRMAVIAWSAARANVHPRDPVAVAMRSWARRTTQRY